MKHVLSLRILAAGLLWLAPTVQAQELADLSAIRARWHLRP